MRSKEQLFVSLQHRGRSRPSFIQIRCSQFENRNQIDTKAQNIVDLFDKVFKNLGQERLFENSEFRRENDLDFDNFKRFYSVDRPDRIDLIFEISNSGLEFWIDNASEIPSWSHEQIAKNSSEVEEEIINLFANPIEVEKQGNKTTIRILNKDGQEIRNYRFYRGLGLPWLHRKSKTIYKPYFEK